MLVTCASNMKNVISQNKCGSGNSEGLSFYIFTIPFLPVSLEDHWIFTFASTLNLLF